MVTFDELLERLREFDVLLDTDPVFPSVTGLVVEEKIHGSWWAHPRAHELYGLACQLRAHPDVLTVKLISKKVTFVHRPLWPAFLAIATARELWQMLRLSEEACALLKKVDREGKLQSSGAAVRELETCLLVQAESVHTERGFHKKDVRSWERWRQSVKLRRVTMDPAEAKARLETIVARLNRTFGAHGTLPWP